MSSLTDEGPNDLAEELVRGEALQTDESGIDEGTDDWQTWTPAPVDEITSKLIFLVKLVN